MQTSPNAHPDVPAKALFDADFFRLLEGLHLRLQTIVRAGTGGMRSSRQTGTSVEFSDFREYAPGDDFRRIDWNAYARFERLFVKLFMEEKQAQVHVLLDASASMDNSEYGDANKSQLARRIAGAVAYLAIKRLDCAFLHVLHGAEVRTIGPLSGRASFYRAAQALEGLQFAGETALSSALRRIRFSQGGKAVLISDMFSTDDPSEGLKYLQFRGQDASCVHILAPEEIEPPFEGRLRLVDAEGQPHCELTVTQEARQAYMRALAGFRTDLREALAQRGFMYIPVRADADLLQVLFGDLARGGVFGT